MNANNKITQKILEKIKNENILPWEKPWKSFSPSNLRNWDNETQTIKDYYKGANRLLIGFFGDGSEFYLTFNQVKQMGGRVKRGSHGVPIVFYTPVEKKQVDKDEEPEKYFLAKSYIVFSQKSIQGVDFPELDINKGNPIDQIDLFIKKINTTIPIMNEENGRAFYSPSNDYINIPDFKRFSGNNEYYRAVFHEMIHATGHKDRLDRFKDNQIEGGYSFEELVAEIGSCFLSNYFGIDPVSNNSVAYLKSWVKALEDNPTWITKAANKAEKAFEWLINTCELENNMEVSA